MYMMVRVLETTMVDPHYLLALRSHDCLANWMGSEYRVFDMWGWEKKRWKVWTQKSTKTNILGIKEKESSKEKF